MTKYIPNIWYDRLEGVQVCHNNAEEIANNLNGEIIAHPNGTLIVVVPTSRGRVMLNEGDWIVKEMDSDRYRIVELVETSPGALFKAQRRARELKVSEV